MSNVTREAKRDAEEFMKAKMYYGKGSGNRRKAIRNKVMAKKTDPEYAKAFDIAYSKLDPAKYASGATKERRINDGKDILKQSIKDGMNIATGNPHRASTGSRFIYEIITKLLDVKAR